jgi:quinol monooxygenase YgiN
MATTPWRSFAPVESEREYLALLTYLPLRSLRSLGSFTLQTLAITRQLKETTGLIGYSLMARPVRKEFWTLSVWNDESALARFANMRPHADTMTAMRPFMKQTKFIRWKLRGSDIPPKWEDALPRWQRAA